MTQAQDKKIALASVIEAERQQLQESLAVLRESAQETADHLRHRVHHLQEALDVRSTIGAHRYLLLAGAFAVGLAVGLRHLHDAR